MADNDPSLVDYSVEQGAAIIVLNAPPANAYSYAMMQQLDGCVQRARMDDEVHVIVITGAGEKFFCAGADIAMLRTVTTSFKYMFCLHANETMLRLEHTPKLVIAALNGHCVGGGLEVALACDLRVAKQGGGRLGLPEVNLGVLPGTGGTQRLSRALGKSLAIQLMAEGRLMTMDEAADLGLVNKLLPSEGWWQAVLEYAQSFCPPRSASKAIGHLKRAVQTGAELSLEAGLALERELQQRLFETEDCREGLAAYDEKRTPVFKGR